MKRRYYIGQDETCNECGKVYHRWEGELAFAAESKLFDHKLWVHTDERVFRQSALAAWEEDQDDQDD